MRMSRTIKIAAIQLKNYIGERSKSFAASQQLIRQAAIEGANLVALPELSTCGYIPNETIWEYGEPANGATAAWAGLLAKQLGIYIGVGFLECDGKDFYNSYMLVAPNGNVEGIIRKICPESYCFRSGNNGVYIDTEIGRIGIGICADNHLHTFFNRIKAANIDLMLMPHAWATPYKTDKHIKNSDIKAAKKYVEELADTYSKYLGVPVAFINSIGEVPPMPGILGKLTAPEYFRLQGGTQIVFGGRKRNQLLSADEGFLIAEVKIGNGRISDKVPPTYDGWLHPGSKLVRKIIIPIDTWRGKRFYTNSKARIEKVNACSIHK